MAALDRVESLPAVFSRPALRRRVVGLSVVWIFALGNAAAMVFLWIHGGNLDRSDAADVLTSVARITGLLSAYLALVQVVLLARIPALERLVGFDRLTVWHRWNGHACIDLVIAHVVFSVWGYALMDRFSLGKELSTMLGGGVYPGMITATVGTAFLLAVVATSVVIARRRLSYEWWHAVHLLAYGGIALAWFHQIPTGNELVLDRVAADYWRALYVATLLLLVVFRIGAPLWTTFRHGLRVVAVQPEGPGTVSLRIGGRDLERLGARPGQFFSWRFLARGRWWTAHPFSLSEKPGDTLRITVKALGDHTARLADIPVGTRVVVEGPFGTFTEASRRRRKLLLVAGGIGITPVRALMEEVDGDVTVLYRALSEDDLVFRAELDDLTRRRGIDLHYLVGDHASNEAAHLLSADHLRELVPDLAERDVYVCGPPAMTDLAVANVRAAGVPRRHIHAERFAL
jgi:predicted ferric reductase